MECNIIEKLPPELLYLILESLASPQDLLALITSSKNFHILFSESCQKIVSRVLCNSYGDNLQQALGAFYASTIHDSHDEAWTAEQRRNVEVLLKNYHNRDLELPPSFEDIVKMCHQFALVEKVIGHYSHYASQFFANGPESSAKDNMPCADNPSCLQDPPLFLATVEKGRIRRALLHFDMYCHLFPLSNDGLTPQPFDVTRQSELFLSKIPLWEIEEMCSVQQYICNTLDHIVQKLENEFVKEVLLLRKLNRAPSEGYGQSITHTGISLELFGLELFTSTLPRQRFNTLFQASSQGLRSLVDIVLGDEATRRHRILKSWPWYGDFLWQGVQKLAIDNSGSTNGKNHLLEGEDRLDSFSGGWTFVSMQTFRALDRGPQVGWGGAADTGLAFWNPTRAKALRASDEVKFSQRGRVSAETRLRDHHVAFSALREILDKHCPEDFLPPR